MPPRPHNNHDGLEQMGCGGQDVAGLRGSCRGALADHSGKQKWPWISMRDVLIKRQTQIPAEIMSTKRSAIEAHTQARGPAGLLRKLLEAQLAPDLVTHTALLSSCEAVHQWQAALAVLKAASDTQARLATERRGLGQYPSTNWTRGNNTGSWWLFCPMTCPWGHKSCPRARVERPIVRDS